ncbi:pyridoxamine 5'-phosphate oxidase family protein [Micromonospora tulbaghiae]|uniref:PPOX class probable F420-dependent enzyme n=1 Tax=Micromonospora tulbaghiae TaxID=479978 RepID=A0ABY0KG80_9ACTN|nr:MULTISPECIES: TIGR03618 family F420-dependent PPOX class oxidoreductase [Micromonospora]KAB1908752.1 TIGR03618 family F420-dependent PPOX class oxidoreductase [Micromonospora sp. AMSO1212t]MDX5456455.1 TIGR03618 family F420-dependent PPOX class oxidoreductase [Micromonospora tulbaghiae]SCE68310.1 PPOX class probable F420-dependent enzyme [Micromonospora tulbaghiae]
MAGRHRLDPHDERVARFFADRHLATLTTPRADGTPHVVPVGVTFDPAARLARVITSAGSAKARHVAAAGPDGVPVAVCQVDGRWWLTVEGRAVLRRDPESVAEAERRYAERYRMPRPNPERVVIEIAVTGLLGSLPG